MQRKIHHQRDYDRGDARIKKAIMSAYLTWTMPKLFATEFGIMTLEELPDIYGFNFGGRFVRKY